jgi:uncharacterized protein YyaL (SSP411 family)
MSETTGTRGAGKPEEAAGVRASPVTTPSCRFSPRPNRAHLIRWRPWDEDAFLEARRLNRPLAVFITAFWCGFCQRMDETSLSDGEVITLLNGLFVPVRLEESQRPDVDVRYNQDGWPTIAFLTPGGTHLASVNYTPPQEFAGLLARVVDYYQSNREALADAEAEAGAGQSPAVPPPDGVPTADLVGEVAGMLEGLADSEFGGFGGELKMLHTEANEFLLYLFETTGERWCLDHVLFTLTRLRSSATFDAKDGGFFRYSSRRDWQEPHPEKLLEDQARLLGNYLHAYRLSGDTSLRETAAGLVQYLESRLSDPGIHPFFCGCQDYVRFATPESGGELRSLLDTYVYCDANAQAASACFEAADTLGIDACRQRAVAIVDEIWRTLRVDDGGMYHYSDGQPRAPGLLADSVYTGLALLDACQVMQDGHYLEQARDVAAYLLARHRSPAGGFFDISRPGPGSLKVPLTLLAQNAAAGTFFVRLARLTGDAVYREAATWALRPFGGAHREHGAFAAGLAHAAALLLTP